MRREFDVLLVDAYNRHNPVKVGHVVGEDDEPSVAERKAQDAANKLVKPFLAKCQTRAVLMKLRETLQ